MTEKRPTLPQRVAAGAALLDRKRPEWFTEVNPDLLEMADGCLCVLGQVFHPRRKTWRDGFILGLRSLGIASTATRRHRDADNGFNTYDDEYADRYYALENLWKREIRARLRAAAKA